jgi:hypothetical protein
MKSPFVRIKVINDLRVKHFRADGSGEICLGGQKAWRYNNPGNIGYGNSKFMKELGAIGKAQRAAVFPDYETGRQAEFLLLKTANYQERTLNQAIEAWAPQEDENDTERYQQEVHDWTKFDMNRKVKSLSEKELVIFVNAIERKEGSGKGKVIEFSAPQTKNKITRVRKNKKGTITAYYDDGMGWISKAQGIKLARQKKIDAVVATSSAGHLFLRTRPGTPVEVQLDHMG